MLESSGTELVLETSKAGVSDLKNIVMNSTPDKTSGLIAPTEFDSKLIDLGLNIGTENLEMCKVSVKDLKFKLTQTKGSSELPLKDSLEFDNKLNIVCLNPKIPSINQTYINTTIQ